MIGRKLLIAFIEKFRQVCRTLSCQKVQSSPVHLDGNPPDLEKVNKSVISTVSEEVEKEEMGNKALKVPDIDPSAYQDYVLDVIKEQKTPLKETFSPYTPLPAIGKSSLEEPKSKIVRRKTYRVLEPIYVKGPSDVNKFIPKIDSKLTGSKFKKSKSGVHAVDQNNRRNNEETINKVRNNCNKDPQVFGNNSQISTNQLKERNIKLLNFCIAPEPIKKRPNNKSGFMTQEQTSTNLDKENATAFWIDF